MLFNLSHTPLLAFFIPLLMFTNSALSEEATEPTEPSANLQALDRIAVVVEDTPILLSTLNRAVVSARAILKQTQQPIPNDALLQQQVLNNLINKTVQEQAGKRRGITIDNALLNEEIQKIAKRNNLTLLQLKQKIEADGTPFSDFREVIKHELLLRQLLRAEVYRKVYVSEQDVDDYINENNAEMNQNKYQLQHILISTPRQATAKQIKTAQTKANELLTRIQNGEDFATLAKQASDGQRASHGGYLGWLSLAEMPSIFAKQVKLMDKGDVSKPIQSPSGIHLVKVADMQGEPRAVVKQVKARHILIKPTIINSDADIQNTLNNLRERIANGESFEVLAKVYSDDGSAVEGGDLGWANPDQYVPEFKKAVTTLPLNTLSTPIRTQFGWHLVEVLERRDYDETKERRRNEVRNLLREQQAKEQQQAWLAQLRDEAYIDYRIKSLELPAP